MPSVASLAEGLRNFYRLRCFLPSHLVTAPEDSASPPPFRHEALEDPASCIRLLQPLPGRIGDPPTFTISAWPRDRAPKYNAISYTWGELETTTLEIDGCILEVRQNCFDVLVQAHRFDNNAFLWVDAVCIDQDNINEKNHQVRMMHAVYLNAAKVLACVGGHQSNSELLFKLRPDFIDAFASSEQDVLYQEPLCKTLMERMRQSERETMYLQLEGVVSAFGLRPYWRRLWIVQEVVAGNSRTLVLCGADFMSFEDLGTIHHMLENIAVRTDGNPLTGLLHAVSIFKYGGKSLTDASITLANFECRDPRDRIYGLLALIDWEAHGIECVFPDYSKTAWGLAEELVPAVEPDDCRGVLRMLRIDSIDPAMCALIRERLSPQSPVNQRKTASKFEFDRMVAAKLSQDINGTLFCGLRLTKPHHEESQAVHTSQLLAPLSLIALAEFSWCKTHGQPLTVLSHPGGYPAALVCHEARSGDFLVIAPTRRGLQLKAFILRPSSSTTWDVIGNGIISNSYRPIEYLDSRRLPIMEEEGAPQHDLSQVRLLLSATPEDIMMFTLGLTDDAESDGGSERDPVAELLHLMVKPVEATKGAARLLPIARG